MTPLKHLAFAIAFVACAPASSQDQTPDGPVSVPSHIDLSEVPEPGERVHKSDEEWAELLTEEQYHILRNSGTERAFTGAYWDHHGEGTYHCAGCGSPLYSSEAKFDSGTGWPSYYEAVEEGRVETMEDRGFGMVRTEMHCTSCGGHLGHIFEDGPPPTGLRHCVNSESLFFVPTDEDAP